MARKPLTHRVRMDQYRAGTRADVLVCMGSQSDWMSTMRYACEMLDDLGIHYVARIVSAHRTPDLLHEVSANAQQDGFKVVIAGAGGAAHLPGMFAGKTSLPVIGVPVQSKALSGIDSLYSIVQMPPSTPVATMAIGASGAKNAGLMAGEILGVGDAEIRDRTWRYRLELGKNNAEEPEDEDM